MERFSATTRGATWDTTFGLYWMSAEFSMRLRREKGVTKPTARNMAINTAPREIKEVKQRRPGRFDEFATNMADTEIRSSNNAIPGASSGNTENSRLLVYPFRALPNTQDIGMLY